jgi:hypothetical protein
MQVIAHIGNTPVEEWLPFLVPVLALYIYDRRKDQRRRDAVKRLPDVSEPLDEGTVKLVVDRWSEARHRDLSPAYLPLFYPPGPDGMKVDERLLQKLEDLGYLDLEERDGFNGRRAWLTFEEYELVHETEAALLSHPR